MGKEALSESLESAVLRASTFPLQPHFLLCDGEFSHLPHRAAPGPLQVTLMN